MESSSITPRRRGERVRDVEHERGDVELGGVAAAGEHRQHPRLAEPLLGEVVDDEAVAAEQLDAEVGGAERAPPPSRATPGSPRTPASGSSPSKAAAASRTTSRAPCTRAAACGEVEGVALVVGDRLAEHDPLGGVLDRLVERRLRDADRDGGRPEPGPGPHRERGRGAGASQRPRSTVAANGTHRPRRLEGQRSGGSGAVAHLEQAQRVALAHPHPAQRRPARRPFDPVAGTCGSTTVKAHWPARRGSTATTSAQVPARGSAISAPRLPGGSAAGSPPASAAPASPAPPPWRAAAADPRALGEVEAAEREPVEHGEHPLGPPPGASASRTLRRQLPPAQPLGGDPQIIDLGCQVEIEHDVGS